jgi:hypothetical protein
MRGFRGFLSFSPFGLPLPRGLNGGSVSADGGPGLRDGISDFVGFFGISLILGILGGVTGRLYGAPDFFLQILNLIVDAWKIFH